MPYGCDLCLRRTESSKSDQHIVTRTYSLRLTQYRVEMLLCILYRVIIYIRFLRNSEAFVSEFVED